MHKTLALFASTLLASHFTLADTSLPPILSFESDTISTSGYRGCFPGRTLYDINPQPDTHYFARENNGKITKLDVTSRGDVNEIHCPGPFETQDSITIMADFMAEDEISHTELAMPYRNTPYPQIKSIELNKDNTLTVLQESEYVTSGFKLHVRGAGSFAIAATELSTLKTNVPLQEGDKMHVAASGFTPVTVDFFRKGESVEVAFPERAVGMNNVYVNGVHHNELPNRIVVGDLNNGDIITLSTEDGPLLSAIYRDGNSEIHLNIESTIQALCYFCKPDNSATESIKQSIRKAMEENGGFLGKETRSAEAAGRYESLMQALIDSNERRIRRYYGEGDAINFAQMGLEIKTDWNGETWIVNKTTLPIAYAVSGELIDDEVSVCDTYTKPFNVIRPSSDFITRHLQGWSGLNSQPVKIETSKQQIEVITSGEKENHYPYMGVEDFVNENPQCKKYQPIRDMLESTARASYLLSIADDLVGAIMKTNLKTISDSSERTAEALKAVRSHVEAEIAKDDKLFVNDAEALEFVAISLAGNIDSIKDPICKNVDKGLVMLCQRSFSDTAQILRSLDAEDGVDGKTMSVGLAANAINDVINDFPPAMFAKVIIDTYQKTRDNFSLDELFFVQIPQAKQYISGVSSMAFDVTSHTPVDIYGEGLHKATFFVEQNNLRIPTNQRRIRSHSQNLTNVVQITIPANMFVAGEPARLIALNSLGNEITMPNGGRMNAFDGNDHPLILEMGPSGIYVKKRGSDSSQINTSVRFFYEDHLLWESDNVAISRYRKKLNAEGERTHTINGKNIIYYSPEGRYHNNERHHYAYTPGVYRAEYRANDDQEWVSYPLLFTVPGGPVDYRVCGIGTSSATITHLINSTSPYASSFPQFDTKLGQVHERLKLLELRPDEPTCIEHNSVMMWGGVIATHSVKISAAPDGSDAKSRVWIEYSTSNGTVKEVADFTGGGKRDFARYQIYPKQVHPDGPLW